MMTEPGESLAELEARTVYYGAAVTRGRHAASSQRVEGAGRAGR